MGVKGLIKQKPCLPTPLTEIRKFHTKIQLVILDNQGGQSSVFYNCYNYYK